MDNLIVKYFQNSCNEQERQDLLDWIDASPENKLYFKQLRNMWDACLLDTPMDPGQSVRAYLSLSDKLFSSGRKEITGGFRYRFRQILKIAAVVIISSGITWIAFTLSRYGNQVAWQTIEVPVGQRVLVSLGEGSKIWLNSMTKFSYPESFSHKKRLVKLDGEAYFEVARNEKLPFEVETEHMKVEVKGTKFNLYAYSSQINTETTLVEGKILLSQKLPVTSLIELKPLQKAIYNRNSADIRIINKVDAEIETSWTRGIYNFHDITFDKLIERLEHYFDVTIEVKREDILTYRCTGKFLYDETISDILDVIKTNKPFRYKISNRTITIY